MEWQRELESLIARGLAEVGAPALREALEDALAAIPVPPSAQQALEPPVAVLGVNACDAGWVGVLVRTTSQTTLHVGGSLVGLLEQVRDQVELGVVGLTDGERAPEAAGWLATHPTVVVVEVPDTPNSAENLAARGLTLPAMYSGMGFTEEDLVGAGAAVLGALGAFT